MGFRDKTAVVLIFIYWITYEHFIFFRPDYFGFVFTALTYAVKLLLPVVLIWYTGINLSLLRKGVSSLYVSIFTAFIVWIGFSTLVNGDMLRWLQLIPRLVFFVVALNLFYKKPQAFHFFAKLIIAYVLFALLQYILTYVFSGYDNQVIEPGGFKTSGIYGLYSNIASMMTFPGMQFPVIRLSGFWNEPSNAAGSAFSAGFLALYLQTQYKERWGKVAALCFLSGFLALSNAGYFALALGILVWIFLDKESVNSFKVIIVKVLILVFTIFIVWLAFFGREYVQSNGIDGVFIRSLVGLRDVDVEDVYSGRFVLLQNIIEFVANNPMGSGLLHSNGDVKDSASAIVQWFLVGGVLGLVLIILREVTLYAAAIKLTRKERGSVFIVAALAVVMGQHLSYGSWMNPSYLTLAAAIIAFNARHKY